MKTLKFKSSGYVYGFLWGGGKGAYPARELQADTKKDLLKQANEGLNGSLDSGMGYESLIGALLEITTITTVEIEGKPFTNEERDIEFIGKLSDKDKDFLMDIYYND
jgi:hypothetical protein